VAKIETHRVGGTDFPASASLDLTSKTQTNPADERTNGSVVSTALAALVPVLFVLLFEYFARRSKKFDADQVVGFNELALDFALPGLLLVGRVNSPRTQLAEDASVVEIKTAILNRLLRAVKQPYVWAPVVALAFLLIGIPAPSLLTSGLRLIGQMTSGVSLFVGGLVHAAAYSLKLNRTVAVKALFKSLIQPALLLAPAAIFQIPSVLVREGVVSAALPSAVIAPMLAARYKTYEAEAGSTMLLTTVVMMFVVPVSMFMT
jgi:predicted permease